MAHYLCDITGKPHYFVDGDNGYTLDGQWALYISDGVFFSRDGRPLFYRNDGGDLCGYDRVGIALYPTPDIPNFHDEAPTSDQEAEMWLGPNREGKSVFASKAEAQAHWLRWRDYMLQRYGSHGRRPFYWWQFEAERAGIKFKFPRDWDRQQELLAKHGLLDEQEREALAKERPAPARGPARARR
jgi:hypothetical protein